MDSLTNIISESDLVKDASSVELCWLKIGKLDRKLNRFSMSAQSWTHFSISCKLGCEIYSIYLWD